MLDMYFWSAGSFREGIPGLISGFDPVTPDQKGYIAFHLE
jgi:hypothetical protein